MWWIRTATSVRSNSDSRLRSPTLLRKPQPAAWVLDLMRRIPPVQLLMVATEGRKVAIRLSPGMVEIRILRRVNLADATLQDAAVLAADLLLSPIVPHALSAREFSMAQVLLENTGQVLTRDLLLDKFWGYDFEGSSNVVDVYVRYLRNKLGPERIITVRGAGYRLTAQPQALLRA